MPSTAPRVAPATPPYSPDLDEALRAMMPRSGGIEPLRLFRTLVRNLPLATGMRALGSHLLGHGRALDTRDREIVIARTCARCGCEYEWGVHVATFARAAKLTDAQVRATVLDGADAPCWSAPEQALIAAVDALHTSATLSANDFKALSAHYDDAKIFEIILLCGFYRTVSYLANGLDLPLEANAARFPR